MEKSSREEVLMGKLVREAGLEKPSAAFSVQVMQAIVQNRAVQEYKPLISVRSWFVLGIFVLLFILCVLHLEKDLVPAVKFLPERFSWPQISLSKTMTYAIVFTALFLLEIPALKRLLEKQYRF